MKQPLTATEIERTMQLCFDNPAKACAIAQVIVDTCGVVGCATFARVKSKSVRAVQYKSKQACGLTIENRVYPAINGSLIF